MAAKILYSVGCFFAFQRPPWAFFLRSRTADSRRICPVPVAVCPGAFGERGAGTRGGRLHGKDKKMYFIDTVIDITVSLTERIVAWSKVSPEPDVA